MLLFLSSIGAVKRMIHLVCEKTGAKVQYLDILDVLDDEEKVNQTFFNRYIYIYIYIYINILKIE